MKKQNLKLITAILIALSMSTQMSYAQSNDRGYKVKVGDQAPDFEATLINGEQFRLSDCKGKVLMLQFTASWCGVCRKEMPFIENEIYQELKDKDFILVGIDRDEPLEKVKPFIAQTKVSYPIALDPGGEIFMQYAEENAGITRNVIIDRTGKIIFLTRLFEREEFDAMKEIIFDAVLQEK